VISVVRQAALTSAIRALQSPQNRELYAPVFHGPTLRRVGGDGINFPRRSGKARAELLIFRRIQTAVTLPLNRGRV